MLKRPGGIHLPQLTYLLNVPIRPNYLIHVDKETLLDSYLVNTVYILPSLNPYLTDQIQVCLLGLKEQENKYSDTRSPEVFVVTHNLHQDCPCRISLSLGTS